MSKMRKKPKKLSGIERKQIILDRLKAQDLPPATFKDLAQEFGEEFDEKTIRRDIEELRELGADIQRQGAGKKTVYKIKNDYRLPNTFPATDLLSLTILRQAIRGYSGKHLEKQLEDIAGRIAKATIEQRDYFAADIDAAITFRPPPVQAVNPELWEAVLMATLKKASITFDYKDRNGDGRKETVHPYHMVCSEGEWYLLAGKPGDPNPAQYSLARVSKWEAGPENAFKLPGGFNPRALLEKSFRGFISIGPTKTVRVRVTGFMVRFVRDRVFHPKQKVKELDGGRTMEISFEAGSGGPYPFGNVVSWVLSMGPCAKALEPPELVERVKAEARELLRHYGEDDSRESSWH